MKIADSELGIISNCPLCGQHSLHIMNDDVKTQQCINCGHATSDRLLAEKSDEIISGLSEDMKKWHKIELGKIWLPSFITLPLGMVFPIADESDNGESMKWGFAPMVDIPEEEQVNYPITGKENEFHDKKYDTDNAEIFDEFVLALSKMNELAKYLENN